MPLLLTEEAPLLVVLRPCYALCLLILAPNTVYLTTSQSDLITADERKSPSAKAIDDSDDNEAVNIWDSSWVQDLTVNEH
jgi:hypothetical protein